MPTCPPLLQKTLGSQVESKSSKIPQQVVIKMKEGSDIHCTERGHLLFASTRKIVFVDRLCTQTFFGGLSKRIGCKDFSFPFRMVRTIYHWSMISSGNHQPIKKPVKIAVTTWHSLGAHCRPKFTTAAAEMVQTKQQFYLRTIFEQLTVKDFRRTPYF